MEIHTSVEEGYKSPVAHANIREFSAVAYGGHCAGSKVRFAASNGWLLVGEARGTEETA